MVFKHPVKSAAPEVEHEIGSLFSSTAALGAESPKSNSITRLRKSRTSVRNAEVDRTSAVISAGQAGPTAINEFVPGKESARKTS